MTAKDTASADPLAKMREPFPAHQISKLPKPTKQQTEEVKADFKKGQRCDLCGSWHHPNVVHLDYVGHAALTDRLLDADPAWFWEPLALRDGLPAFDSAGGLWIKLTIGGVSRLGYGHAAPKQNADPGSREKEVIGDALRNAAMRFGAALDLWHKGELHLDEDADTSVRDAPAQDRAPTRDRSDAGLAVTKAKSAIIMCMSSAELLEWGTANAQVINALPKPQALEIRNAYGIRLQALKTEEAEREKARAAPVEDFTRSNDPFDDEIPF